MEILEFGEIRSPVLPPILPKPGENAAGKKPAEKAAPEGLAGESPAPAPSPA